MNLPSSKAMSLNRSRTTVVASPGHRFTPQVPAMTWSRITCRALPPVRSNGQSAYSTFARIVMVGGLPAGGLLSTLTCHVVVLDPSNSDASACHWVHAAVSAAAGLICTL